jgi:glycosyltransferase involved in cell wall biosynthesis
MRILVVNEFIGDAGGAESYTAEVCDKLARRGLKCIIVASDYMKRCLVQQGFAEDRLLVNPLFSRFPVGAADGPREDCLLYVGQLSQRKGVPGLLKITDQFPGSVKLILAGQAPTKEVDQAVENILRSLAHPERVIRLGWKSGDEWVQRYRTCFALIMPSLWEEPFGLAAIEALSQATPVIAFEVGGLGEWPGATGGGVIINRGDWPKMVEAVQNLLDDAETRKKSGEQGQAYAAREMTLRRHVDKLEEIFHAGAHL